MGKILSSTKLPLHVFHNMHYTIISLIISQMVFSDFSWLKIILRCFVKYYIMSKWHTPSFIWIKIVNWKKNMTLGDNYSWSSCNYITDDLPQNLNFWDTTLLYVVDNWISTQKKKSLSVLKSVLFIYDDFLWG